MEEATQVSTPVTPDENNVVQFGSREELKKVQKQQRHQMKLLKERELRWTQPFANAKIEDLMLVGDDIRKLYNNHSILVKLLVKKGLITEADLKEQEEYEQKRLEKFLELKQNTEMSAEDKKAAAQEWNIPLAMLGLEEQPVAEQKENG